MKKTYQKPTTEMLVVAQESMMAASSLSIHEEEMGASSALGNEEADFDVWK